MRAYVIAAAALSLALSACVSKSKHQTEMDSLKAEIQKEKTEVQSLNAEKAKLQDTLIASAKDRGQLKTSLDEMKKAITFFLIVTTTLGIAFGLSECTQRCATANSQSGDQSQGLKTWGGF